MKSFTNGVISSVQMPPTTSTRKIRVWMRPFRVGLTGASPRRSRLPLPGPAHPLRERPSHAYVLDETVVGQVSGDPATGGPQPQEPVDGCEVRAEGGRAGRVHPADPAAGAGDLEGALHLELVLGVAAGTAVLEEVGEDPVLGDVGLEAGA